MIISFRVHLCKPIIRPGRLLSCLCSLLPTFFGNCGAKLLAINPHFQPYEQHLGTLRNVAAVPYA